MAKPRSRVRILSVPQFRERFGSVEQCAARLSEVRWPEGFVCPRCGSRVHTRLSARGLYQCSACRRQTSLTAGTVFHKSRVPLDKWFWAIYRLAQDKKGCSATLLSKELDVSYPTAWLMTHKIREAMAGKSLDGLLSGLVELDDSLLAGERPDRSGRAGSAKGKTPLLVAVEATAEGRPGRAALAAVKNVRKPRVARFVASVLAPGSKVRTGRDGRFAHLASLGYEHEPVQPEPANGDGRRGKRPAHVFAQLNLLISNLKRFVLGRHHTIVGKHGSRYLGEFAYRFNHRWHEATLFDSLLACCVRSQTITYKQLKAAEVT